MTGERCYPCRQLCHLRPSSKVALTAAVHGDRNKNPARLRPRTLVVFTTARSIFAAAMRTSERSLPSGGGTQQRNLIVFVRKADQAISSETPPGVPVRTNLPCTLEPSQGIFRKDTWLDCLTRLGDLGARQRILCELDRLRWDPTFLAMRPSYRFYVVCFRCNIPDLAVTVVPGEFLLFFRGVSTVHTET